MSTSCQKPQPDSEWETAAHQHIAELLYPTYGQHDTNRSLAIADMVMPAVRKAVDICVTAEIDRLRKLSAFLIKQIQQKDARTGEADAKVRAFLSGDAEDAVAPRTERSYWVAICAALNAAVDAGMPIGIDLDGTLTDHTAWSVVWNPERKRWAVADYDDEGGAR
ncbi:hypothetical protein [Streptomyces sp. NRRL S-1868]|uniref:hypothetical protein n=1 Tax=Streptomyces sp. NRRL S-1868 TaxID=1463892 RepID=UPI0004C4D6FF|nr:hypothetical protein [Streptomyces sp. NRRL S-1868]